jgi:hypothetical protein
MAQNKNPFERGGKGGAYGDYAKKTYALLMTKEWTSYVDIHKATYPDVPIPKQGISHVEHYGELKKAVGDIKDLIEAKCPNTIKEEGSNRKKRIW